jgi:hypothetical protein
MILLVIDAPLHASHLTASEPITGSREHEWDLPDQAI